MNRVLAAFSCAVLLAGAALTGCYPGGEGNVDEQKDTYYLNGRAKVSSLDYKGAIQDFEKALENNPRSASAHFELALLYEEQMQDYAAAIFHYERHLRYRPNSEYAERARERIKACKMDLVKTEILGPVNQQMQRDLERLSTENMLLKQSVENLETQLRNQAVAIQYARTVPQVAPAPVPVQPVQPVQQAPVVQQPARQQPRETAPTQPARTQQKHTVREGDKLTTIARKYGVELQKLMAANPGVQPTRLRVGQVLNIP